MSSAIVDTLLAELTDADLQALAEKLAPYLERPKPDTGWLDVTGAALHLQCPKSRLYSLVSAHRIPVHRDGSRLLFDRHELDCFIRTEVPVDHDHP
jgi:excisionase family DNA binding protein